MLLITSDNGMATIGNTANTPEGGTAFDSEQQLAEATRVGRSAGWSRSGIYLTSMTGIPSGPTCRMHSAIKSKTEHRPNNNKVRFSPNSF